MLALVTGWWAAVLLGAPAAAHTDLVSVDPADGSRLDRAPRQIVLEFSEEMDPVLSAVTLTVGGGGSTRLEVARGGAPSVLVATVPDVAATEPAGAARWRVAFRVVSADGHPVAGVTSFTVLPSKPPGGPGAGASSAPQGQEAETVGPTPPTGEGGVPWLLIAAPVGVLGVLLLVVAGIMRMHGRDEET